jgi:siroheme synthase
VLETRLGNAAADAKANAIEPPTIIIVGNIAGLRRELIAGMIGR